MLGLGLFSVLGLTGCQIDVGGQTLPSPWYLQDDVQYFPPGAAVPAEQGGGCPKGRVAGTDPATLGLRNNDLLPNAARKRRYAAASLGTMRERAADPKRRGDGTLRGWRP